MRVVYVTETLGKGGAESQLSHLATRLRDYGHASSVISLSAAGWWASRLNEWGVPIATLSFKSGLWAKNVRPFCRLVSVIREQRPDAVVSFLYPCSIWASLAGHLAGVPLVVASRRDCGFQREEASLPNWLERLSYAATTLFVANSHAVAESLERSEEIRADRIEVIYNGVDLPEISLQQNQALRKRLGLSDLRPVIGMMANFWPHKNHLMLVRAAKLIIKKVPEAGFVLVGRDDEYQKQVRAQIADMRLESNFLLLGQLDGAHDLVPALDICVLCSRSEGFSNTILEYMAYGKPVIATRVGGNPEAVVDGETGLLVEPEDAEGLAAAVLTLIRDPVERIQMGLRGRIRAEAEFNWDMALKRWDKLLQSPNRVGQLDTVLRTTHRN